jgi:hypothetical protein
MGKKSSLPLIYLIGVALVAVGFCLPMFKGLGTTPSGFKFINFDNFGATTIAALLIFCGAVAGVVFCFVSAGKNTSLIRLLCVVISIIGGIILIIKFNDNWLTKTIGKGFIKHAYIGFYMVLVGWVVGLIGAVTKK